MKRFLTNGIHLIGFNRTKIIVVGLIIIAIIMAIILFKNDDNSNNSVSSLDTTNTGRYIQQKNDLDVDNLMNKLQETKVVTTEPVVAKESPNPNNNLVVNPNKIESVPSLEDVEQSKFKDSQTTDMYRSIKGKSLIYSIKPNNASDVTINTSTEGADLIEDNNQYEVKAGSIIPATMLNGLNSELPGSVIAIVRANVYDSVNRSYLLIPQGSKLVGQYDSNVIYAQERVAVAWNRLIYPDGSSTKLKAIPGTDIQGYSGFYDQVDNHYFRLFGASFIMGVITGAMQYSQNSTNTGVAVGGNPTIGQTMAGSLGQQMGQTGMMITQKNLNVAPTIIIRPNYPFNLLLTSDLKLKPFQEVN